MRVVGGGLAFLGTGVGKQGADADLCSRNADAPVLKQGAFLERHRRLFIEAGDVRLSVTTVRVSGDKGTVVVRVMARVTLCTNCVQNGSYQIQNPVYC